MEKEKKYFMLILISMIIWTLTGCSMEEPKESHIEITPADSESYVSNEFDHAKAGRIAEILSSIYDEAGDIPYGYPSMPSGNKGKTNTVGRLDTIRSMVARLGENGYAAVDSENQVNMTRAEQVLDFCKAVDEKENAETTILVITEPGFRKFDLKSEDGNVTITRGEYQFDSDGQLQNISTVRYPADFWQYTEEGYLIFEGRYFSEAEFALTLSDALETTALRVLPLDETCRELNRTYLLPVGYEQNNLFLCNWSEDDFGDLDFYDLFDRLYPGMYSQPVPYRTDGDSGAGGVYQIPEDIFESVIRAYFNVSSETLRSKTTYVSELASYEYRLRGFYEVQYPEIAYPEVVSYSENEDGTISLMVNGVYPEGKMSKEFSHITVIRPLTEDRFQYVSNEILLPEEDYDIWWHSDRLTEEEWKEAYGGNGE